MTITAKTVTNFTADKASAIMIAGGKLDRRLSSLAGNNYSTAYLAMKKRVNANDEKWLAIASLLEESHSQYDAICMTGFLDI